MSFIQNYRTGKVGESEIACWLGSRGFHVLPVYDIERSQKIGPAVYTADNRRIIAPDILAFNSKKIIWVEAKHKNAFTIHRKTQTMVTGIDLHNYLQYIDLKGIVKWPIWILFLHRGGQAKYSPISNSGLYGRSLDFLMRNEHHRHSNWGKEGMVYWAEQDLIRLADYPLHGREVA